MRSETLKLETKSGNTTAFVASPDKPNGKAVIVVHEWWGLNNHIKDIAGRHATEGFVAVAPDLYRGTLAKDSGDASRLMNELAIEDGLNTISSAISKAGEQFGVSHFGVTGYCMGGTFALRSACELEGISAAVVFYGDVPEESILRELTVPTIFISGVRDEWINPEMVAKLEDVVERFELPVRTLKYEADHAFFNDTRPEVYDADAAKDAWANAVGFFNDSL
jgi:carboxymethylenebutenolidase